MNSASDPKPVVTGYPAPHGGGGGAAAYAYPAPPGGGGAAAYAYHAAPPHAAPYYGAPPPAAVPPTYYSPAAPYTYTYPTRSAALLRRLIAIAIVIFLLMGAATFILWIILRPRVPEFSISAAAVSGFNLSSSSQLLSAEFDFTLSVGNPNQKMSVHYERVHAAVFYGSNNIAETSLPPLDQPKENTTDVRAVMVAASEYVGDDAAKGIAGERDKGDGAVSFNVGIQGWVMFKSGAWRTRMHEIRAYCDGIRIGLKNATAGTGALVGRAKLCQVTL